MGVLCQHDRRDDVAIAVAVTALVSEVGLRVVDITLVEAALTLADDAEVLLLREGVELAVSGLA